MKSLVSPKWLFANLRDPDLIILDASSKSNINSAETKYPGIQIRGARWIDMKDKFSDAESPLPNTLLSPEAFQESAQELGVKIKSKIVVYDNIGIYNSPRIWWMFRVMGHGNVAVLNGGLPKWKEMNFPCEAIQQKTPARGNFISVFNPELYRNFDDVTANLESGKELVIDARSNDRFMGLAPEPRAGLRSGNIPNSINLNYEDVLEDGQMKSKSELEILASKIKDEPLVFTCGSGLTACITMLALDQVLDNPMSVYDGSWTEWGSRVG